MTKEELSLNQHIEDLRERMRLLRKYIRLYHIFFKFYFQTIVILEGDRKANIDVLEANKAANKEDIKRLRDENKELRQKLALLQRVIII